MFFYEIHEGDEDVGTAVLLAHEQRFDPDDFFTIVKKARALLSDAYEEETLSEAIANELQRAHGFLHVTDDMLIASVNVGETDLSGINVPVRAGLTVSGRIEFEGSGVKPPARGKPKRSRSVVAFLIAE